MFQLEFVFKVRLQVFEHEDDALGVGEENRAGIGEFDGLGVAHEEDDAQFFFQGLDGAADGGLEMCSVRAALLNDFLSATSTKYLR